jgi:hypothetical protein
VHCRGLSAAQQLKGSRIVFRNVVDVEVSIRVRRVNDALRPIDDRQRSKSQKIEFDEPDRLNVVLVELGNELRAAVFTIQRSEVRQLPGRDNDAAGVLARIAREAFQRSREVNNRRHLLVIAVHRRELFRLLQRLLKGHADFKWN